MEGATGYQVSVWTLGTSVSEARDVNLVINKDNPTLYTPAVDGHLGAAVEGQVGDHGPGQGR